MTTDSKSRVIQRASSTFLLTAFIGHLPACSGAGGPIFFKSDQGSYHVNIKQNTKDIFDQDISENSKEKREDFSRTAYFSGLAQIKITNKADNSSVEFGINPEELDSSKINIKPESVKLFNYFSGGSRVGDILVRVSLLTMGIAIFGTGVYFAAQGSILNSKNGTCVDQPVEPVRQCQQLIQANPSDSVRISAIGGGLLLGGSIVSIIGSFYLYSYLKKKQPMMEYKFSQR